MRISSTLPNWLPLTFRVEDEPWFHLDEVIVEDYRLELDLARGVLHRRVRFQDQRGRRTALDEQRFVHMGHRHLAALRTTIRPLDWSGTMQVRAALDGTVVNGGVERYQDLANRHLRPLGTATMPSDAIGLKVQTIQSKIRIAQAARTRIEHNGVPVDVDRETHEVDGLISQVLTVEVEQGDTVVVEKTVSMFTSRDRAIAEPLLEAFTRVRRAAGFEELLAGHERAWAQLWARFDVRLGDGPRVNAALRLHLFQLLQTVSPQSVDLDIGVPARGWHGEAYRGHVFWDELFIFPLLTSRLPEITRSLLEFRYRRLAEAQCAATDAGYRGAMFPWQSASNGREETQLLHLNPKSGRWLADASHLQRHINLAVAFNVWQYFQATDDVAFLGSAGAEMFLQICRFWASVAQFDEARQRYVICGVMGPDEYHDGYPDAEVPGLDNNAYTNLLAVWVLARAPIVLEHLQTHRREELVEKLNLHAEELEHWDDISRRMFVPFHDDGAVISQFEGYEKLEEFDWSGYTARYGDIARLDRILEAEGDSPNRYKLSKQADVVMLFYLFAGAELSELFQRLGYPYDQELIRRNVDYYTARTSHGSTLSSVVHSWVLARMDRPKSWQFFQRAMASDLEDVQGGTTREGIHLGAMAGAVDLVQRGFLGMQIRDGHLAFNPALPDELRRVEFHVQYRGHCIDVSVDGRCLRLMLRPGRALPIDVVVRIADVDDHRCLAPGDIAEFDLSR